MLRYHAEIYKKQKGYVVPTRPESTVAESRSVMRPYGAFAVISPFNFPLSLATGMAGAALITGNTVILKPTSTAPFSVLKLYYAFTAAGVPPDAIQYITGPGAQFGGLSARILRCSRFPFVVWLNRALRQGNDISSRSFFKWGARTR
jgi:1-pyrroline-5-carboxylate dehydrogenase